MSSFFKIPCPGCGRSLKVSDKLAGKSRSCPYCNVAVKIPDAPLELEPESESNIDLVAPVARPPSAANAPSAAQLPNIQVVDAPRAGRGKSATKKRKVIRQQNHSSWFSSSSESASSDVSIWLSGLIGLLAAVLWYAAMYPIRETYFGAMFWQRGPIPFPTTIVFCWAMAILLLKSFRLAEQRKTMLVDLLPTEVSREITLDSIDQFIDHINELPGTGSDSFLINRVVRGIEHFRVRRNAAETVTMMESQSVIDANNVAGSYTIVKVFIWALPILGFIGTVMGVSAAVASLAGSLSGGESMDAMKGALQDVFAGLGTAFDTTLLALVMSLIVKIPASAMQKSEEDLITSVDEYCNENLLRRLNDGRAAAATAGSANGNETAWQQWLGQMTEAAGEIQKSLALLTQQTVALRAQTQSTINQTNGSLSEHLAGVQKGLAGLNGLLEKLGEQQVVVQQIEQPKRGWFGR
jgi:hypothetical protein